MEFAEAKAELLDLYKGKDLDKAPYFNDYINISAALGSGPFSPKLIAGLKVLERALQDRLLENFKASEAERDSVVQRAQAGWAKRREGYKKWLDDKGPKPQKIPELSHLLTATLHKREIEDGFKQEGAKVPIYVSIVGPKAFIQALKDRRHWKDVGAGDEHGEFTHRIQWYVLSAGGVIPHEQEYPARVFETLGNYERKHPTRYLWDDLCDRDTGSSNDDWRKPSIFNGWLRSHACKAICPLLSTFIAFRYANREFPATYGARKLHLESLPGGVTILDYKDNKYQPRKP